MAATSRTTPSGATSNPARTRPPSVSRTEVVTPQNGQGTPVSVRMGQGKPQPSGRCARRSPPARKIAAGFRNLRTSSPFRCNDVHDGGGMRLKLCGGTLTTTVLMILSESVCRFWSHRGKSQPT